MYLANKGMREAAGLGQRLFCLVTVLFRSIRIWRSHQSKQLLLAKGDFVYQGSGMGRMGKLELIAGEIVKGGVGEGWVEW